MNNKEFNSMLASCLNDVREYNLEVKKEPVNQQGFVALLDSYFKRSSDDNKV